MRQAGFSSSVDRLRIQEMSVFKRTIPGKSPARSHSRETLCGILPKNRVIEIITKDEHKFKY